MDNLRSYLLSEKNFNMLENIIPEKVYNITGVEIEKKDPFFQQNMLMVATSVIRDELQSVKVFDTSAIIKINNIIITECVKHLNSLIHQEEPFSSKLEDIEEEQDQPPEQEVVLPTVPAFKETVLLLDTCKTQVQLENVVSVELIYCFIDFSDYLVTENNNCFCVDNDEKYIQVGNYTPSELMNVLSELSGLVFSIDPVQELVCISQPHSTIKKSLTGSIKESQNQKQVNIDFGVKNSICNILGYSPRTYTLKDSKLLANNKHYIKHTSDITVNIEFLDKKLTHHIPTCVEYNSTIHYTPGVKHKITMEGATIENISIDLNGYNPRTRPFKFALKVTCSS